MLPPSLNLHQRILTVMLITFLTMNGLGITPQLLLQSAYSEPTLTQMDVIKIRQLAESGDAKAEYLLGIIFNYLTLKGMSAFIPLPTLSLMERV